jgi:hypothetical protein
MVKKTSSPNVVIEVLDDHVNDVIKALAAETNNALVDATPVDTGFAKANWRVTLNKPANGVLGAKNEQAAAAAATLGRAESTQAIAAYDHTKHRELYISNNVNYIGMVGADGEPGLNSGSSTQARPFFIQTAVYKTIAKVRRSFKGVMRRIK